MLLFLWREMDNQEPHKHKPSILFVMPSLDSGGAERVMINLMNSLPEAEFSTQMAVIDSSGPLRSLINPKTSLIELGSINVALSVWPLFKLWRAQKPDIVFSTMTMMNFVILVLKILFFHKAKVIVRETTLPSYFFEKYGPLAFLIKYAYRCLYKMADMVICPSQIMIEELKSINGMKTYTYKKLYNPVITTRSEFLETQKNETRISFVSVGRLNKQKGFDLILEQLTPDIFNFDWRWDIVGEGPEQQSLKKMILERGLENHVHLLGYHSNTAQYYKDADALLLPSRWEGLPNVALESLSWGTPVIASSRAGGIYEIAGLTSQSIFIATNFSDFKNIMKQIPKKQSFKSILPDDFKDDNVYKKFKSLLNELL